MTDRVPSPLCLCSAFRVSESVGGVPSAYEVLFVVEPQEVRYKVKVMCVRS